jgi:hypothetical protein
MALVRFEAVALASALAFAPSFARADGSVFVHIDAPEQVLLAQRDGRTWRPVCASPCDRQIPQEGSYRIQGRGITSSRDIYLVPANGQVFLGVSPQPMSLRILGVVGASLGGTAALTGLVLAITGAALKDGCSGSGSGTCSPADRTTGDAFVLAGAISGLSGVLLSAAGIVALSNSSTEVEQEVPVSTPVPGAATSLRETEWRTPAWSAPTVRSATLVRISF